MKKNQDKVKNNRTYVATNSSRKTAAYNYMKQLYLNEHNLTHMPKNGRVWDYSGFDKWLSEKLTEV